MGTQDEPKPRPWAFWNHPAGDGVDRERRPRPKPGRSWRTKRSCDGWPEIGSCANFAVRNCDYCRDCEMLRRAHEGGGEELDTEDCDEGLDD